MKCEKYEDNNTIKIQWWIAITKTQHGWELGNEDMLIYEISDGTACGFQWGIKHAYVALWEIYMQCKYGYVHILWQKYWHPMQGGNLIKNQCKNLTKTKQNMF